MEQYQHLRLPLFQDNVERKKTPARGVFSLPQGRNKAKFSQQAKQESEKLSQSFSALKNQFSGKIDPTLIFEININQGVSPDAFEKTLASMGIHILSVAEGKKGYWVVFSEDEDLGRFKEKIEIYGSEEGANYDFFHAIASFHDIPVEKKIGERLSNKPLDDTADLLVLNQAYQKSEKDYILNPDVNDADKKETAAVFKKIRFNSELGMKDHLSVCGYGLSQYDKAIRSFDNRAVLWDEGSIELNQIKVYSLQLPEIFFTKAGKKKITITLTFTPETRATRGDSYLGNRMEFHLFHSINPQVLMEKYGVIENGAEHVGVPDDLKSVEINFFPGANIRKAGCHQKAWKVYKREPVNRPESPISLVLLNFNKWISDEGRNQNYCISVTFEHEKEIELYNAIKANVQTRTRVR